jgi:uncharacterized protein (TIGR02246 family)
MRRVVLAAFALTVLAACQPASNELTDYQKAEITAEVQLLHDQFWDAWREVDVDRGMSYYLNAPEFTAAVEGVLIHGYAAFDEMARSAFAHVASQSITIDDTRTSVMAHDIACVIEHIRYTQTDDEGVTGPEHTAAVTLAWVRRDGEWKVYHFHNSAPSPETQ